MELIPIPESLHSYEALAETVRIEYLTSVNAHFPSCCAVFWSRSKRWLAWCSAGVLMWGLFAVISRLFCTVPQPDEGALNFVQIDSVSVSFVVLLVGLAAVLLLLSIDFLELASGGPSHDRLWVNARRRKQCLQSLRNPVAVANAGLKRWREFVLANVAKPADQVDHRLSEPCARVRIRLVQATEALACDLERSENRLVRDGTLYVYTHNAFDPQARLPVPIADRYAELVCLYEEASSR